MSNIDSNFDLQEYLTKGGERLIADAVKATLKNPSGQRNNGKTLLACLSCVQISAEVFQ